MSTPIPQEHGDLPDERPGEPAADSRATSAERAQAQAVHELSEPERLDGSTGPVGSQG